MTVFYIVVIPVLIFISAITFKTYMSVRIDSYAISGVKKKQSQLMEKCVHACVCV